MLNLYNLSVYQRVAAMVNERNTRRALIMIALAGLFIGLAAAFAGHNGLARWIWAAGTIPVVAGLAISIVRKRECMLHSAAKFLPWCESRRAPGSTTRKLPTRLQFGAPPLSNLAQNRSTS